MAAPVPPAPDDAIVALTAAKLAELSGDPRNSLIPAAVIDLARGLVAAGLIEMADGRPRPATRESWSSFLPFARFRVGPAGESVAWAFRDGDSASSAPPSAIDSKLDLRRMSASQRLEWANESAAQRAAQQKDRP